MWTKNNNAKEYKKRNGGGMYKKKYRPRQSNYFISINLQIMYRSKKLFGSGARVKILKFFFVAKPGTEFFGRDIARRLNLHINGVRMELKNLEQLGILKVRLEYPKIMYRINHESPRAENLRNLVL